MRAETLRTNGRETMRPRMRNHGLRRARLRKRWSDETAYIMSNPGLLRRIMEAAAQLDRWRESNGLPPFEPARATNGGR